MQGVWKVAVHSLIRWEILHLISHAFEMRFDISVLAIEHLWYRFWRMSKHDCSLILCCVFCKVTPTIEKVSVQHILKMSNTISRTLLHVFQSLLWGSLCDMFTLVIQIKLLLTTICWVMLYMLSWNTESLLTKSTNSVT